jgi:hypothetical protein
LGGASDMSADRSDRWLEMLLEFYEQHRSCSKVMSERYVDRLESRCSCGAVLIHPLAPLADEPIA